MLQTSRVSQIDKLGLGEAEYRRLTSWEVHIAIDLSPGARIRRTDDGVRLGRKGSLSVKLDGRWHAFDGDEHGYGPRSLIAFLRPDFEPADIRQYALNWLNSRHGNGDGAPGDPADGDDAARAARYAEFARQTLDTLVPVAKTPAETYLLARGILGVHLDLGWIPDDARPGEGALVGVIRDPSGEAVGIQLGYLDAAGKKREAGDTERRHFWINAEAVGAGFYTGPESPDPAELVYLCEGLENACSLALARPAARVIGLPGIGRLRKLQAFRGRQIIVFRDGDAPDSPAGRALTKGVDHLLLGGATVTVTATPEREDANSLLQSGGVTAIENVLATAAPAKLSPRGVISKSANLSSIDYETARKELAKETGIKVTALDGFVQRERERRREGRVVVDHDVHHEPVTDIAEVLDTARAEIAKYVVAAPEQLDMVTMWTLHTHFVHHTIIDIAISPRLAITAPTVDCGKTTLLEAAGELSHRAQECSSITAAGFFHLHDEERRTLLIDEAQAVLGRKGNDSELQGILLASHRRRSAKVIRAVEDNRQFVSKEFDAWCTYAMTYTGRLNYALETRCLRVTLKRAKPGEVSQHLRNGTSEVLVDCRRRFARWAEDQISLPDVTLPVGLYNRHGDNWRPLFSIAEVAGGHWPGKMRTAALVKIDTGVPPDRIIALLTDIRDVMRDPRGEKPLARMLTADLLNALVEYKDPSGDWRTCNRGGPINAYWLRDSLTGLLRPPGSQRWREKNSKVPLHGYTIEQFEDAFERYNIPDKDKVQERSDQKDISPKSEDLSGSFSRSGTGTETRSPAQEKSPVSDQATISGTRTDTPPDSAPDPDADGKTRPVPDRVSVQPKPVRHTKKRNGQLREAKPVTDVPYVPEENRVSRTHIKKQQPEVEEIDQTWE
jgi:hypothetical protein